MYKYISSNNQRTGRLTISRNCDVRYNGILDIDSSRTLQDISRKINKVMK